MNPLADSFEINLVRKTFLWITVFFVLLFTASLGTHLLYNRLSLVFPDRVSILRSVGIIFNTCILLWLIQGKQADSLFRFLPALVLGCNYVLSISNLNSYGGNQVVAIGAYLVISMVYLQVFAFFIPHQSITIGFGVLLVALGVILFVLLPDQLFGLELSLADIRQGLSFILFFGLVLMTVLVVLNNHINGLILGRTRTYADQLRRMAYFDQSSELPNGLQLEEDIAIWEATEVKRNPKPDLAMVGFRLEGLENLNVTQGLSFTNNLVKSIVQAYKSELELQSDLIDPEKILSVFKTLYRVESNSFLYLVHWREELRHNPNRPVLAQVISKLTVEYQGRVSLTFQGGISLFPHDAASLRQLFSNVLNLLHAQRSDGLGHFVSFNPQHYQEFMRKELIRSSFAEALATGEFYLAFQPKVDVASGATRGFEALSRWKSPRLGQVSPAEFIPLAEQYGFIEALTLQILDESYRFIRRVQADTYRDIRVSVNLSPGLLNEEFLDGLLVRLQENGLGTFLEFEITEGILLNLNPVVLSRFSMLRHAGASFSIDDFGTGYSNLGYLQNFEVDVLKIDKRFIDGIPGDEKNAKLVRAILQMARSFDMKVVAEGVEYREQRDFLLENNCEQIQGYFYSKPLPASEALSFLLSGPQKGT